MKIKSLYKWQLLYMKNSLFVFYGIIYALYIGMSIVSLALSGSGDYQFSGMDSSSSIFVFIMGISFYPETIRFSLGNGVSRKTLFLSQLCSAGTFVAIMGILDVINNNLFSLMMPAGNTYTLMYIGESFSPFHLPTMVGNIVWTVTLYFMMSMLGFFISTFFYRVGKFTKTIIIIGLCVSTLVLLPILAGTIPAFATFLGIVLHNLWLFVINNPYNMVLVSVLVSALLAGSCYLLVRRAPMKTV